MNEMTTLHLACLSGSSNAVSVIFNFVNGKEFESEFLSRKSANGMNAFHYACLNWTSDVLLTLLQSGKFEDFESQNRLYKNDLNEDDNDKAKPLHTAVMTGCLKNVDLILNFRQQALQAEQQRLQQIKQIEQAQNAQKANNNQTLSNLSKASQNELNYHNLSLFIQRTKMKNSKKLLSGFPQQFQPSQQIQKPVDQQIKNQDQKEKEETEDAEYVKKKLLFKKRNQELSKYTYIINSTTKQMNKSPLIIAVQYNDIEIVSFLIKQKLINLNLKDKIGRSALHLASILGYSEIMKILLHKKGLLLNEPSSEGMTPLHYACMKDQPEVVSLLLKYQENGSNESNDNKSYVNINARTPWTLETPLHFAKSASVLNTLIDDGVNLDLSVVDRNCMTPLHVACKNMNEDVAKILIKNSVSENSSENFSATSKIDVNFQDKSGKTALHYTCLNSDLELTKSLLQVSGININLADKDGLTPIMSACHNPDNNLIDLLLSRPELVLSDQDKEIVIKAKEIKV